MPNTLTNVKDIKVAQNALQPWMAGLLPLRAFSTNFSPEPADKLDTVRVPVVGAPSASSEFAGNYTTTADSTVSVIPVQLNKHKFKTVHVTAREASETALNVLETLVASAVKQLATDVLQDIFSAITADPYGAPAIDPILAANFNYKKVLAVREACSTAKMPVTDRSLVLDGAYFTQLLGDDIVAKSFMVPIAQPGVVEAQIRRLGGFDIYETVILPENGEKLVGFAAHPSGLAVAMRYLEPVAEYDEAGAVTDPETGLTFGYLRYTETQSNRIFVTVECLYGWKQAIRDGLPISEQFPVETRITKRILGGCDRKLILTRGFQCLHQGHHGMPNERLHPRNGRVLHYKWNAIVLDHLGERLALREKTGYAWGHESERFLNYWREKGRIVFEDCV